MLWIVGRYVHYVICHGVAIDVTCCMFVFFFKQKTAYEMRISDWSSDVCSSDLALRFRPWRYSDPAFATLVGVLAVALQKSTSYHDRPSGCFDRAQASRARLPTDRRPETDCVPPLPATDRGRSP